MQRLGQGSRTSSSNFINGIKSHIRATSIEERAPIVFIAYGLAGLYLKQVSVLAIPIIFTNLTRSQIISILWHREGWILSCTPQLDELKGVVFIGVARFA